MAKRPIGPKTIAPALPVPRAASPTSAAPGPSAPIHPTSNFDRAAALPADPHPLLVATQVRPSQIFGQGLYAAQKVRRGTVVCLFALNGRLITEDEFVAGIAASDYHITRSGTRLVGRYFTYSQDAADLNYINHSFEPNLLCHCGIVVARRDIAAGEEFTIDYRYLVDSTEIGLYDDVKTGRQIRGLTAKQTLLATAREFMEIVEGIEDWEG